jgi:hypothetical protein
MSSPVITVTAATEVSDIAHLLTKYHIKRVPVLADNRIVGIVSRADLVRTFADVARQPAPAAMVTHGDSFLSKAFGILDKHFHGDSPQVPRAKAGLPPANLDLGLTAKDFQTLVANFEHAKTVAEVESHRKVVEQHKKQVEELINHHIDDAQWQNMMHCAREVAQHGGQEFMLLRFPNDLCSDGGRAINVGEHGWPETLRGEAAEIYLRWEQQLRPQGFHLSARTLEYPGGFPGDIGLFLVWGH